MKPGVPETLRCGSPGYVAPEVLNNLGYGKKADIFSAGVILSVMLTGVSPFRGRDHKEVLLKNKEGTISVCESHWSSVSEEAKDLVLMMIAKEPNYRCTAADALKHHWFSLKSTNLSSLSNAQDNMKKYQGEMRFDVGRIKPMLSIITCTPPLCTRSLSNASPLIIPDCLRKLTKKVPVILQRSAGKEEKKSRAPAKDANKVLDGRRPAPQTDKDDSGNFDESDIDEKPSQLADSLKAHIHSFVPRCFNKRELPKTPGFSFNNSLSYLKLNTTPNPDRRNMTRAAANEYLRGVAGVRTREDTKSREKRKMHSTTVNPFNDSVCKQEELETQHNKDSAESINDWKKNGSTPKLSAKKLWIGRSFAPPCKNK